MNNLRIITKKESDEFYLNTLPLYDLSYITKISDGSEEIVKKAIELIKELNKEEDE